MGRRVFSFLVVALFLWIASPLLSPVAMGGVCAVLVFPWLERLERRKLGTSFASAVLTVGVTLLFLFPGAFLIFIGAKAGLQQIRVLKEGPALGGNFLENVVQSPRVQSLIERVSQIFPIDVQDVLNTAQDMAQAVGLKIADLLGKFFAQLPGMAVGMIVMILSIFFFLVDGRKVAGFVRRNSVLSGPQTENLIGSFAGMCRSVILATVASGFGQSILFSVFCIFAGAPNVALTGFVVFLASFLPLIGATPVTFGVAIFQLLSGNKGGGIALLIAAALAGLVDNFIRPAILRGASNLHPLLAFIAAFGGLQVLGFSGVFLGPIVAGLFVVTVQNLIQDQA